MSPTTEAVTAPRTGVYFTPFKAADALRMVLTERASAEMWGINLAENYAMKEHAGPAWTMWVDDTVVGCAGLTLLPWPGVAHAWLLPTERLVQYPKTVVLTVAQTLRDLIAQLHLRRVDCEVLAGFTRGERFVRVLGFTPHGPLRERWGPNDTDFQPYVLLQPREAPHAA